MYNEGARRGAIPPRAPANAARTAAPVRPAPIAGAQHQGPAAPAGDEQL